MEAQNFVALAYIVAALFFINALRGLSKYETAQSGNTSGAIGMGIAVLATIWLALDSDPARGVAATLILILVALSIGAFVGLRVAKNVGMTEMPELIALLHSFVGLAAVLVGYNTFISAAGGSGSYHTFLMGEIFLGVFIGAVTFTGSIIAYLKLSAKMNSAALTLPGRNWLNLGAVVVSIGLMVWFMNTDSLGIGLIPLILMTIISLVLGLHLVAAIGGGDMPVVVSMLNSYSGWAAAAAGFMLENDLLIITGALVGSSGAYLSYIMCKAMNRKMKFWAKACSGEWK